MKKRICITLAAVILVCLVLTFAQMLVMPKYIDNPEGALIAEYYAEAGNHDVIFVGDCEVYESFVPAVLWQEYGIRSYVRGSAQQLVWQSYYLLEETFRYEKPKAVVYNVLALKYGTPQNEAFNRMTLDGMKWSREKIQAIKASMTEDENFLDYLFPLLRYHSRITELTAEDWRYLFSSPKVSDSGYLMQTAIRPRWEEPEAGRGLTVSESILPESAMDYLDRMRLLCAENGSELILVKAPTQSWGYWWYDEWDDQICDYANQKGLTYYNFISECDKIGIDWTTDTYDEGVHLNVYGAEKLTRYFGKILRDSHGLSDYRTDPGSVETWTPRVEQYEKRKEEKTS